MILNSFRFLIVLPVTVLLYIIVVGLCRNSRFSSLLSAALLTAISYGFFIYNQPTGAIFLFIITLLTYIFAILIENNIRNGQRTRILLITAFALIVLAPLLVFKYANFIAQCFHHLLMFCHMPGYLRQEPVNFSFIIPLGISFFTFQAIGYMWDVYRNKITAERNFLYYILFVGFFPQIASGPISKASELLPQIKGKREVVWADITEGVKLMLAGFFLKAVVADRLATFVNPVYADYNNFSGATCFIASIFYSLQIYGDFAGYSLIAIGVGRLFGFKLINNFNRPYLSHSVTEFWKRWHISLTRWLRDYVYIPLGGNRHGQARTYGNIMATFFVSGLWHGANFTFIVWGAIHGIIQCLERFFKLGDKPATRLISAFRIAVTFLIVNFAWIFFRMPSLKDAIAVIQRIITGAPGASLALTRSSLVLIAFATAALIITEFINEYGHGFSLLRHRNYSVRIISVIALIFMILTVGVLDSGQFIYVNF